MEINLNGQRKLVDRRTTVGDLLAQLQLEPIRVAVEINETLVPRRTFADTMIHERDQVEIVTLVGGG